MEEKLTCNSFFSKSVSFSVVLAKISLPGSVTIFHHQGLELSLITLAYLAILLALDTAHLVSPNILS